MDARTLQTVCDKAKQRLKQFFGKVDRNRGREQKLYDGEAVLKLLQAMDSEGMLQWLANNAPEIHAGRWRCKLCNLWLPTGLPLDVHVCPVTAVKVPLAVLPTYDNRCMLCAVMISAREGEARVHTCRSFLARVTLLDSGGLASAEGKHSHITAMAGTADNYLKALCMRLQRLMVRVAVLVDAPEPEVEAPEAEEAPGAEEAPMPDQGVNVFWSAASSQLDEQGRPMQGLWRVRGSSLVCWGPQVPAAASGEGQGGGGAAGPSERRAGSAVRGCPFGGIAALARHSSVPTASMVEYKAGTDRKRRDGDGDAGGSGHEQVRLKVLQLNDDLGGTGLVEVTYDHGATAGVVGGAAS